MKQLIIQSLFELEEKNDIKSDNHILIISNKSFDETKRYLTNKRYDYLICNNTLFDNKDNILYSNYININSENFLSFAYKYKKTPYINLTNPMDETSLYNFVKISIKYNLLVDLKYIIDELEIKYGLSCKYEKGFLNFYVKNGLKKIIYFLIQENNYTNIFNYCNSINPKKIMGDNYIDRVKYVKTKKYKRWL